MISERTFETTISYLCICTFSFSNITAFIIPLVLLSPRGLGCNCIIFRFLPRDAMHKRGLCRHAVSVCVSVTFVDHVKTNKDIFEIFSPTGSHTITVFQRHSNILMGTPLTGRRMQVGVGRNCDAEPIYGLTACVNAATGRCCQHGRQWSTSSVSQVMTHRW